MVTGPLNAPGSETTSLTCRADVDFSQPRENAIKKRTESKRHNLQRDFMFMLLGYRGSNRIRVVADTPVDRDQSRKDGNIDRLRKVRVDNRLNKRVRRERTETRTRTDCER